MRATIPIFDPEGLIVKSRLRKFGILVRRVRPIRRSSIQYLAVPPWLLRFSEAKRRALAGQSGRRVMLT